MSITIPPTFGTPTPLLTGVDVVANTTYSNQSKTLVGSDGTYYVFYSDFDTGQLEYSYSTNAVSWSPSVVTGDVYFGYQFATWYDVTSNTFVYARVPSVPDGTFYMGIGNPSGGSISWTYFDSNQATNHGGASGVVEYPSVYFDGSLFWVTLTTSPDGINFFNEIWSFNPNTALWTEAFDLSILALGQEIPLLVGVASGMVLALGSTVTPSGFFFYETTDGWAHYDGYTVTSGNYDISLSGITTFGNTVYLSATDSTNALYAVSYQLGQTIVETTIQSNAFVLGGTSISTDGNSFSVVYTDTTDGIVYYTYSIPLGTLDLTGVTWTTPVTISTGDNLPAFPQMYYSVTSHSRPSTVLAWTDLSVAIMTSIVYPAFTGTLVAVTGEEGFGAEGVSIERLFPPIPPSGGVPISSDECNYIALTYHQQIDTIGTSITYNIQNIAQTDGYEHPVITYKPLTITAFLMAVQSEYDYVEAGFLPTHYATMWVYQVEPEVGDRVTWQDIVWEVRSVIPKMFGNCLVYYDVLLRRVLTRDSGGGHIAGTTEQGTSGTLLSGGSPDSFTVGDP